MKAVVGTFVAMVATAGLIACGPKSDRERNAAGTAGVVDQAKDAASKAADKTSEAVSSAGEMMTDVWITATINTKFVGEDALKDSDINVDTNNHVVTLNGTVRSRLGKDRAVELAKATDGVNSVVDHLKIGAVEKYPKK